VEVDAYFRIGYKKIMLWGRQNRNSQQKLHNLNVFKSHVRSKHSNMIIVLLLTETS